MTFKCRVVIDMLLLAENLILSYSLKNNSTIHGKTLSMNFVYFGKFSSLEKVFLCNFHLYPQELGLLNEAVQKKSLCL